MGNRTQMHFIKVNDEIVWESKTGKLLGVEVDNKLTLNDHVENLCRKTGQK